MAIKTGDRFIYHSANEHDAHAHGHMYEIPDKGGAERIASVPGAKFASLGPGWWVKHVATGEEIRFPDTAFGVLLKPHAG